MDQLEYWKMLKENYTEHNPSDDHIISLETFNPDKEYILTPDDVSYEQNFLNAIFKNIIVNHNK